VSIHKLDVAFGWSRKKRTAVPRAIKMVCMEMTKIGGARTRKLNQAWHPEIEKMSGLKITR
jgi:hypothetical protein